MNTLPIHTGSQHWRFTGKNSWLDAGYFITHIGGEGIIPKYNFFTSLSPMHIF